jgi:chromosome segregation ATPase
MSWRSKPDEVVPEEASTLEAGDAALAQRLAELTHREVALRRITEAVEKERTRLEERERELASAAAAAAAGDEQRLQESARRAEQAEQRVRELEQRVAELEATPSEAPPPAAAIERAPIPPALESETTEGTYTLQRLERLVEEARDRGDPQAEEWAFYLPLLRDHAEPDGRLPAQFASLVDSVFAG